VATKVADIDQDGGVNGFDLCLLMADWLKAAQGPQSLNTDMNLDGIVDICDFAKLANSWQRSK
jgi:hypothetical protein